MWRILGYTMAIVWWWGWTGGSYEFFSSETVIFFIALGILIYVSNAADGWEYWNNNFRD